MPDDLGGLEPPARAPRRWFFGSIAAVLLFGNLLSIVLGDNDVKIASVYCSNVALVLLAALYFGGGNLDAKRFLDALVSLRTGVAAK